MATRVTDLTKWDLNYAQVGNAAKIKGGALATQTSRNAALRSQMQILPHGRRVVANVGLHGGLGFWVQDGVDPATNSREYPEPDWDRTLYRGRVNVTPGYELWVAMVSVPSGPCQHYPGGGAPYLVGEDAAKLEVYCTYDNGVTTADANVVLVRNWSVLPYKALDPADGGAFDLALQTKQLAMPTDPGWVEHVTADLRVVAIGGLRPVEVIFYEQPKAVVTHNESHRECSIPMVPQKTGMPDHAIIGNNYPNDPRLGSHQTAKSMRDYRRVVGPYIFSWSSWDETGVALADDAEGEPEIITSSSFVDFKINAITAYGVTNPGWSISSGGTSRNLEQSGPLELRGKNGCIPVLVRAYCKVSAGTGTIRFQTAFYSLRELTTTSTSYGWVEGLAWLRCGVHQSVESLLEVLGKCSGGGTLSVRYLSCEHYGNYVVTE